MAAPAAVAAAAAAANNKNHQHSARLQLGAVGVLYRPGPWPADAGGLCFVGRGAESRMRRWCGKAVGVLAVCFGLVLLPCLSFGTVFAASVPETEQSVVQGVYVEIVLFENGKAHITETWDVMVREGTEWCVQKKNVEELPAREIVNFSVREEAAVYQCTDSWNEQWTMQQKAGKCSIESAQDGDILRWGVGYHGWHRFVVQYTVKNAVIEYDDANGLYLQIIGDEMSVALQYVEIVISYPFGVFAAGNNEMYALGFPADEYYVDGKAVLQCQRAVQPGEYVAIWMAVGGQFNPEYIYKGSFWSPAQYVRKNQEPAHEVNAGWGAGIWTYVIVACGAFFAFFIMIAKDAYKPITPDDMKLHRLATKLYRQDIVSWRGIPYEGDLPCAYTRLLQLVRLRDNRRVVCAWLQRWILRQQVEIVNYWENPGTLTGERAEILLHAPHPEMGEMEQKLYAIFQAAADKYGVLSGEDFETQIRGDHFRMKGWLEQCVAAGEKRLMEAGDQEKVPYGDGKQRRRAKRILAETPQGMQRTGELLGLEKYLKELVEAEEELDDAMPPWEEYMVFGQLFGMGKELAVLFEKYYEEARADAAGGKAFTLKEAAAVVEVYKHAMDEGYIAGQEDTQEALRRALGRG